MAPIDFEPLLALPNPPFGRPWGDQNPSKKTSKNSLVFNSTLAPFWLPKGLPLGTQKSAKNYKIRLKKTIKNLTAPSVVLRSFQDRPRPSQDPPKSAPRPPKTTPRRPKSSLRDPQDPPKCPQESQEGPKTPKNVPKRPRRLPQDTKK